jgi:hypothetical protein
MIRQSGRKPSTKTTFSENLVKTWSMHVPVTMGYTESNKIKRESKMSLYQLLAECSESSKVSKLKSPETIKRQQGQQIKKSPNIIKMKSIGVIN